MTKKSWLNLVLIICSVLAVKGDVGHVIWSNNTNDEPYCMTFDPKWTEISTKTPLKLASLVWVQPHIGCVNDTLANVTNPEELAGNVAVFARGDCVFSTKVLAAAASGASAALIISQENSSVTVPIASKKEDYQLANIPVFMMSFQDGETLMTSNVSSIQIIAISTAKFDPNTFLFMFFALFCITFGSIRSGTWLTKHQENQAASKNDASNSTEDSTNSKNDDATDDDEEEEFVVMSPRCIFIFIIVACVMLMLMFFFYNVMIYIILVLFALGGTSSLSRSLFLMLSSHLPRGPAKNIPCLGTISVLWLCCWVPSLTLAIVWFIFRHSSWSWILQDILALPLLITAIEGIRIPSFKAATILLVLFLIYDVFFVFITPLFTPNNESVMVSAATGGPTATESMPIVLRIPRFLSSIPCLGSGDSMLGFGDIIVPGIVVAYCRVLDIHFRSSSSCLGPYFSTSIFAYFFGLSMTYIALYTMNSAQPALLYLGPSQLIFMPIVAAYKKQFKIFWNGVPEASTMYLDGNESNEEPDDKDLNSVLDEQAHEPSESHLFEAPASRSSRSNIVNKKFVDSDDEEEEDESGAATPLISS